MDWSDTSHSVFNLFPENLSNTTLISPSYFSCFATKQRLFKRKQLQPKSCRSCHPCYSYSCHRPSSLGSDLCIFCSHFVDGSRSYSRLAHGHLGAKKKHDQKGWFKQNASNNASNEAGGSDIHTLTRPELLAIYVLTITPKAAIASSSWQVSSSSCNPSTEIEKNRNFWRAMMIPCKLPIIS